MGFVGEACDYYFERPLLVGSGHSNSMLCCTSVNDFTAQEPYLKFVLAETDSPTSLILNFCRSSFIRAVGVTVRCYRIPKPSINQ